MPNFIIENKNLCLGAKMLFTILCDYARDKSHCYPSKTTLAKRLNVTLNTLKAWLKQLLTHGFVRIFDSARGHIFHLYSPCNLAQANKVEQAKSKEIEIINEVSNSDSKVSKIDTEINVKKLNTLTPPYIPQTSESKKEAKVGVGISDKKISFDDFWEIYPKKENKESARRAFYRILKFNKVPSLAIFCKAIDFFKAHKQWERENGRYIPQLHNFLNNLRWEEVPAPQEKNSIEEQKMYTNEELELLRKREEELRQTQKDEQQKHEQEMVLIDKEWEVFIKYFEADKTINNILAKRCFISLHKQNKLPKITAKQERKAFEFLEPFYKELKAS